jgi:hypothetical protein
MMNNFADFRGTRIFLSVYGSGRTPFNMYEGYGIPDRVVSWLKVWRGEKVDCLWQQI